MDASESTIFSDFLTRLNVRHTAAYSNRQCASMPFQTMFGLKKLLESYGVDSVGIDLGDTHSISALPVPFIAQTDKGLVIVSRVGDDRVEYISQSVDETADRKIFESAMTGKVLVASVRADAGEPDYDSHRFSDMANKAKPWVLTACCVLLFAWLFVTNRIYENVSTVLVSLIDIAGIYITYLLVQKSAHIKNRHADAVCSVVEAGGCDDVLSMSASKFFGIFGWSEVGFAYFSVSLLCLLMFPQYTGYLALCNLMCLPFSFWSVWYQRFRAKTWCTLCLCVQAMLWLLFFCYLGGGWLKDAFPLRIEFFVLGLTYVAVMLAINALMPLIDRDNKI